ncbi:hypothetical protein CSIM01_02403 [Colletotrichum simmondsii]|uniref:Uncharacterized protein n=1 Tax=Colletotrichum simmondsii TaxID=703756 RepID=A0A135S7N6_9PEZI|nr:hypothetical protein CSIM01_02403 [Colletotrichum simmondsii]
MLTQLIKPIMINFPCQLPATPGIQAETWATLAASGTAAETHHLGHESSEAIQVPLAARSNAPSRSDLLHISISWIMDLFTLIPCPEKTPPAISGEGHKVSLSFDS